MIYSGMKTKNKKSFLNMDERNKQFALGQEIKEFQDIAIIMTVNSLFLISALLYFGAIPVQKLKIRSIRLIYILLVVPVNCT